MKIFKTILIMVGVVSIISLILSNASICNAEQAVPQKKAKSKKQNVRKQFILRDIKINSGMTTTDVTISQPGSKTPLEIKGNLEYSLIGDSPRSNLAVNGAVHHIKGRVEMEGLGFEQYIFEGDEDDPLTFRCVHGTGYVYQGGKGKVITKKTGKEIKLGYSN